MAGQAAASVIDGTCENDGNDGFNACCSGVHLFEVFIELK